MSSCPCFFSFQPMSHHISHFPHFHLATSLRHHVPTRTTKWLVACARALASALVYAASYFRVFLVIFILFLGDLPSYTPPFRRIRCSRYMRMSCGMPGFSSDHTTGLSACRVVLGVAEAFRAARLALRGCSIHAIHPRIAPSFLPVLCPHLAHCAVRYPKNATKCYIYPGLL
jgi:hypothetical protein